MGQIVGQIIFHLTHLTQKNSESKMTEIAQWHTKLQFFVKSTTNFHNFTKNSHIIILIFFGDVIFGIFPKNCFTSCFSLIIHSFFATLWNDSRTIYFCATIRMCEMRCSQKLINDFWAILWWRDANRRRCWEKLVNRSQIANKSMCVRKFDF